MAPREAHCNIPVPPAQGCADKLVSRTALRLIRQLPDRVTYELCNDAVSQLCSMGHCPIAVVCVAGVARQGKSYILNRLVEAAGGFAVSPSVQPCTHGIWMWPEAVTVNGKAHKLVSSSGSISQDSRAYRPFCSGVIASQLQLEAIQPHAIIMDAGRPCWHLLTICLTAHLGQLWDHKVNFLDAARMHAHRTSVLATCLQGGSVSCRFSWTLKVLLAGSRY